MYVCLPIGRCELWCAGLYMVGVHPTGCFLKWSGAACPGGFQTLCHVDVFWHEMCVCLSGGVNVGGTCA